MKNYIYNALVIILFLFFFQENSRGQITDYIGDLTITTQAGIDSFHYYSVTGTLTISGPDIININTLSVLGEVNRNLYIINTSLTNIDSLYNLHRVGRPGVNDDRIEISGNSKLVRFCGLTGLWWPPRFIIISGNAYNPSRDEIATFGPCKPESESTFYGNAILNSQAKIDSFNYTIIMGNLIINDSVDNNITNLNGLSGLKKVLGGVIITENDALVNTDSLSSVDSIGYLHIINNSGLENLTGFTSIKYISSYPDINYSLIISDNASLTSLSGLSNLTAIRGNALISNNNSLPNFNGLTSLRMVNNSWEIRNNSALINFEGLDSLSYVSYLYIRENNNLTSLDGLSKFSSAGGIFIWDNAKLENVDGLKNLLVVRSSFSLVNAPSLVSIKGLSNLETISGIYLENTNLTNLDGLEKLDTVNSIGLNKNRSLVNTDGLLNLRRLGEREQSGNIVVFLQVRENPVLKDLNGFQNALFYQGGHMEIFDNPMLTEFCGLYGLIQLDSLYGIFQAGNNGANPTSQEILANGPCNNVDLPEKSFIAVLLGKNETPPVITDGSGGGMFVLNATRDTLHYWIRLCELKCPFTAAHFHDGAPGVAGPVVKTITSDFIIYPASNDGYAHGIWTSSDPEPLTIELANKIVAGNIYINVHTTGYPSGEIRGQLTSDMPAHLFANLNGSQEVPPVDPAGSGEAWFTLSGDGDSLYYNVTAYDLISPVTAAHFHKAPIDSAGPPVKPISFVGDTLSEGWWTNMDATPLTPELVADLLGCYIYVNVHTSNNPGGEIRGQLYKTDEVQQNFMTLLAAENDADENNYSKLSYYTLQEGKPFHNYEGDITGYDGQKNIVDMTIDIGGNVYLLNNSWTSMLYRIRPEQFDFNEETVLKAKQIGRLRTSPDDTYKWMTNIQFIKGKLYGFDNKTNKLYNINPNNAHVTEIAELSSIGTGTAGFALGADGNVYLLKNLDDKRSQIWKFNKFPSAELTLVTEVPSLGRLKTLSAHPNGNLYSSCNENLYEINLANKTIGVLKDHKITASAMDFDFFTEKQTATSGTIPFTNLDGVTAVGDFTELPKQYELSQNYPNPFNPSTTIKYALPEAAFVKLVVYNSLGEVVRTLVNDNRGAGYYETVFDAKDLSSGMYIYRLEAGNFVSTAKMILIK